MACYFTGAWPILRLNQHKRYGHINEDIDAWVGVAAS
jgi:hypothetical protein